MASHKDLPPPPSPAQAQAPQTEQPRPIPISSESSKGAERDGGAQPDPDEEPESFFVRNTYAQLDVTGVKGDGYEDGVERTRAKLGHDRRSVQLAAMSDARDLRAADGEVAEKELRLLSCVDRFVFTPLHFISFSLSR